MKKRSPLYGRSRWNWRALRVLDSFLMYGASRNVANRRCNDAHKAYGIYLTCLKQAEGVYRITRVA